MPIEGSRNMTRNYTLIIVSYESTDDAAVDNLVLEDLEAKQGWQGKKLLTVEHIQPLSGEEANGLMQP
jgi:hypothetical protein